ARLERRCAAGETRHETNDSTRMAAETLQSRSGAADDSRSRRAISQRTAAVKRLLVTVTVLGAAVRLLPILGLHPLNWDEIEFFRATDWVRQGLVPYRDFWEHHTPLQWYLFAPFAALTKSPGAAAIVWMRIAQVPLWIATFWLANVWMRRSGLSAIGRWSAIAIAVCSSMLMLAAVEYRVDVVACAVYIAALVVLSGAPVSSP